MAEGDFDLPISLLARIGLVVTRCALIDDMLNHILTHFIGADRAPMYVITQNISPSTISDWLRTLSPLHIKDIVLQDELKVVLNIIDEIRTERNLIVHGIWRDGHIPDTATVETIRLDRSAIIIEELYTLSDFDDLIQRTNNILGEVIALQNNILGSV